MAASSFDVFGLGQCAYDHLMLVPAAPGPDAKVEGWELTRACGGPVATALWTLTRWGRRCAVGGVVGDDDAGRAILEDLRRAPIDVSALIVRPGTTSQEAFITVDARTGERRIAWQRPTGAGPSVARIASAPEAAVFLTDGLHAEASVALAARDWRVVVDAGTLRDGTEAMLPHADVFVASAGFARAWTGRDDPEGACERLRGLGVEVAGVTLGAGGYVASAGGSTWRREAWPVRRVVDTTGCGDVFHAGLVEGMLSGLSWEATFELAAWAAAGCATALGGRAGVPQRVAWPGPRR